MPFVEQNAAVLKCPSVDSSLIQQKYQGGTGGFGYNYHYLAPLSFAPPTWEPVWKPVKIGDVRSTSATIAFADSAGTWIDPWPTGTPILIEVPLIEPPSGQYPAVHFRHTRGANVCFLDGHVEVVSPGTRNAPRETGTSGTSSRTASGRPRARRVRSVPPSPTAGPAHPPPRSALPAWSADTGRSYAVMIER